MSKVFQEDEKLAIAKELLNRLNKEAPVAPNAPGPTPQTTQPTPAPAPIAPQPAPQLQAPAPQAAPANASDPYNIRAQGMMTQAKGLEAQAAPPTPPQGIGRQIITAVGEGIQGAHTPGGFQAFKAQQGATERQRQQDLLARAKQYREESQTEEARGLTEEQRQIENQRAQQLMEHQTAVDTETARENRVKDLLNAQKLNEPKGFAYGAGVGVYNKDTGESKPGTAVVKPPREYGIDEYQADQEKILGRPLTAKERQDAAMKFKTQPGVVIAGVRGEESRTTKQTADLRTLEDATSKYNALSDTANSSGNLLNNLQAITTLPSAIRTQLATAPTGEARALITRAAGLTPQQKQAAAAYIELAERVNTIRGAMGATGFRGQQAFDKLQGLIGSPTTDPGLSRQLIEDLLDSIGGQMPMYHNTLKDAGYTLDIPDAIGQHYARQAGGKPDKMKALMKGRGWSE